MSMGPRLNASLMEAVSQQVASFASGTPGVMRVILTTADGFEVASYCTNKTTSAKIAAISSSLQALAEAILAQGGFAAARDMIIQSDTGTVVIKGITDTKPALTLAIFAGNTAVLGHLLWAAKTCCHSIARTANS